MSGSYRVEVGIHTYDNPTGRCDECQQGPDPGCCDETSTRPADQQCPTSPTCDTFFRYRHCDKDNGNACEGVQPTFSLFGPDTNSVDFDNRNFNINPVIVEENEPWNVSNL